MKRTLLLAVTLLALISNTAYAGDDYLLTVKDNIIDTEGEVILSNIRYEERLLADEEYSFDALDLDGMQVVGEINKTGVLSEDTVIDFTYKRAVADEYELSIVSEFYDTDGVSLMKFVPLVKEVLPAGTPYDYEAFPHEHYKIVGAARYAGVLNEATYLSFKYVRVGESLLVEELPANPPTDANPPSDSNVDTTPFYEPDYSNVKVMPFVAEPKMGDMDEDIDDLTNKLLEDGKTDAFEGLRETMILVCVAPFVMYAFLMVILALISERKSW